MPKVKSDQTATILEYALRHLEAERDEIQGKIEHILGELGTKAVKAVHAVAQAVATKTAPEVIKTKRTLSPAARKRIALAQKKRWAEHRKKKEKA